MAVDLTTLFQSFCLLEEAAFPCFSAQTSQ